MKQIVLITGASSGIGKATAILFAQKNYQVIAAARRTERMKVLASMGCCVVKMDVTDESSIQLAFAEIHQRFDHIDILVNNAGYSQNGFLEELSVEQLQYQFQVNVFGLIRVTQMTLPGMRARKSGTIINIGSAGGDFTSPGAAAYHASKYALESLTDGLRMELAQFGIRVVLIKPGGVETEFVTHGEDSFPPEIAGSPYREMRSRFLEMLSSILDAKNSAFPILKAEEVASAIYSVVGEQRPKTRIRIGRTAKLMPMIKSVMSDRGFDNMIMKQLGLK